MHLDISALSHIKGIDKSEQYMSYEGHWRNNTNLGSWKQDSEGLYEHDTVTDTVTVTVTSETPALSEMPDHSIHKK